MNKAKYLIISGGHKTLLDIEDFAWASVFRWQHSHGYACRRERQPDGSYRKIYLHRLVAGAGKDKVTDHINKDSLDNRRKNLRVCTHRQNLWNAKRPKNNTSGFKGVQWNKTERKWIARSEHNKRIYILGRYKTATEAARVYDAFVLSNRGEYAVTNFKAVTL